jgi:dTMP kinase
MPAERITKKGILIVIEGIDGAGKKTQAKILADKLKACGRDVKQISFPRYGKRPAFFSEQYLKGVYGDADSVSPLVASLFYSLDRLDASQEIRGWLESGHIVISDRWTASNLIHQGQKINNKKLRLDFYQCIKSLEFDELSIPAPDLIFFLSMPPETAFENAQKRMQAGDKLDVHEMNKIHFEKTAKILKEVSGQFKDSVFINSTKKNIIRSKASISEEIWQYVLKVV